MAPEVQSISNALPEPTFMVGEVQCTSSALPEPTFTVGEVQITSSNLPVSQEPSFETALNKAKATCSCFSNCLKSY